MKTLFVKTILLIPLGTILEGYIPFFNKILIVMSILFLTCYLFIGKLRGYQWIFVIVGSIIWLIALLSTSEKDLFININMAIYYIFCIVTFVLFMTEKNIIWKILSDNKNFIIKIILIYSLTIIISIPFPTSYITPEAGGWGDALYFISFSGGDDPNRVGQSSLYICTLITVLIVMQFKKKILFFCTLPQLYVFFESGSRTYFVLGICILIINIYIGIKNKNQFKYLFLLIGILFFYFTLSSPMMEKFEATSTTELELNNDIDFWIRLTNARVLIWGENIIRFSETDMWGHWFGNGINFTSQAGIWAHNDFIEIVCSYGYLGLILYLILIFNLMYTFDVFNRKNKLILSFLCFFIWFFNAFFNFFYVYTNAMLSYAFLLMALSQYLKSSNVCKKELKEVKS